MDIRRPRTNDPRELEKWMDEVSRQINVINVFNTKTINTLVRGIGVPYQPRDEEEGEGFWLIPGLPGPVGIQGSSGLSIPGEDGEDAEENYLSLRMGAHGSFADDNHLQYSQYAVVTYGATGNIAITALRGQVGKITGAYTLSLPTAVVNYHGSFLASTAAVFSIDVLTATDIIILDGVALLAGHKITSDGTLGAKVFIECTEAGYYRATSILGIFADGGV